ncbi:MAG: SatD family protein [Leeuwenhoekiella sp.]
MIAIITGDIVNSREGNVEEWINLLKTTLNQYGGEPKHWEIYRGDSFQMATDPEQALLAAIHTKATIKQLKQLDVRMAIGIGEISYRPAKITESNGTAFIRSGACFESLKKQTLAVQTGEENLDLSLNIMLSLSLLIADHWSPTVASVIKMTLENPKLNQMEVAHLLDKSQSSVSEALKRGGFEEIMALNKYYKMKIATL